MNGRNDDYICLVLGETGVGKSSFINTITKSNEKMQTIIIVKLRPTLTPALKNFKYLGQVILITLIHL